MRAGFKGGILAAGKIPNGDGGQHRGQASEEADVAEWFHRNTTLRWLGNKAIRFVWGLNLIRRSPLEGREWADALIAASSVACNTEPVGPINREKRQGEFAFGKNKSESRVTSEFSNCVVEVIHGSKALGRCILLSSQEAFVIKKYGVCCEVNNCCLMKHEGLYAASQSDARICLEASGRESNFPKSEPNGSLSRRTGRLGS